MRLTKCLPRLASLWVCILLWHFHWVPAMSFYSRANFFFNPANMILSSNAVPVYDYSQQQYAMPPSMVGYPRAMNPVSMPMDNLIPAAIQSRHTVEYRDVPVSPKPIQPQAILVEASALPLTIFFRSASSQLNIMQEHMPGQADVQETHSEDEPHRLIHQVVKPIIQEVHEIIAPYRKVTQEIQPVQEEIQTIVARGMQPSSMQPVRAYGQAKSLYTPPTQTQGNIYYKPNYASEAKSTPADESPDWSDESLNLSGEVTNSTLIENNGTSTV